MGIAGNIRYSSFCDFLEKINDLVKNIRLNELAFLDDLAVE
jgi:hypothetical protein